MVQSSLTQNFVRSSKYLKIPGKLSCLHGKKMSMQKLKGGHACNQSIPIYFFLFFFQFSDVALIASIPRRIQCRMATSFQNMSNKWKIAKTITPKLKSKLEPGKNKLKIFFPKNNEYVIKISYFLGICAKFHTEKKKDSSKREMKSWIGRGNKRDDKRHTLYVFM